MANLISKLNTAIYKEKFTNPSVADIGKVFIYHIEQLVALLDHEKFTVLQARKLSKYYARGLVDEADFCVAINTCTEVSNVK